MKIIADSCTLILLAKASVLETLSELHEVSATKEVIDEVLAGKEKMLKDAMLIDRLLSEKKIKVAAYDKMLSKKFAEDFNMGNGEASTVAYAIKADCILATDNKQGRKAASVSRLKLIGSPEITVILNKKRKISHEKAKSALELLKKYGWFGESVLDRAMEDLK